MITTVELRGKDQALLRCAHYDEAERQAVLSFLDDIGVDEDVTPVFGDIMRGLLMPEALVDPYLRGFDEDGNGRVSRREFLTGIAAMDPKTPHGTAALFKRLQSIFAMFDHDRARQLDMDKLVALFEHLNDVTSERLGDPAELALATLDRDPEGVITITQFVQHVMNGAIPHTDRLFRLPPGSDLAAARAQITNSLERLLGAAGYSTEEQHRGYSFFFESATSDSTGRYQTESDFAECLGHLAAANSCGLTTAQLYRGFDRSGAGRLEVADFLIGLASTEPPTEHTEPAQQQLLSTHRAALVFRAFASPLVELGSSELVALLRAVYTREQGHGTSPSELVLETHASRLLHCEVQLTQDSFVQKVLDGELMGLTTLTRFSNGSPLKTVQHRETKGPPEVRWHRTMKIAIDRAPVLTPTSTPTASSLNHPQKKAVLRLERTESASTVVAQEPRLIEMQPFACSSEPTDHQSVHMRVLNQLLKPHEWTPPVNREFGFGIEDIEELCTIAEALVRQEPHVLQVSAPVRVFGDIHGQYGDLMSYFGRLGTPADWMPTGDIHFTQYLFLGDYVDRGRHSLEVAMVLLALKVKFPNRVFLIRGNHEDRDINARDGFLFECLERLGSDIAERAFDAFNAAFAWLPVAASIEGAIFCVHGGPGRLESLAEVESLPRGTTNVESKAVVGEMLNDLLWSDPTEHDSIEGIVPNPQRGSVYYGPDIVKEFLRRNNFGPEGKGMLVRAHECTTDGFDLHSGGRCVTVFSATNYCGVYQNTGAVLEVFWDHTPGTHQLLVQAKLIGPGVGTTEEWQDIAECPPTPPRHWADVYEQFEEIQGRVQDDMNDEIKAQYTNSQEEKPRAARPPTPLRRSNRSNSDLSSMMACTAPEEFEV
eukprot:TRINITY_DN21245_c0_g1_i3.p1 TRINITY_DN21245_c0_g1~~TRINITY_DN21245_c0_g1_i3.p1  ORF type:complete len:882 (+),score=225.94 TRINITY_DN21245_c0_g1_i3:78-2723(+)